MEDRKLSEKESLELITSMIAQTKSRCLGGGSILLMWGYLVVGVAILTGALLYFTLNHVWNWLWLLIPVIGIPLSIFMSRRKKEDDTVVTYSDKVTKYLWSIFMWSIVVLTLMCIAFLYFAELRCWIAILVYSLLVAPTAEIAQGLIVKEKSLIIGGMVGLFVGMITVCCIAGHGVLNAIWFFPLYILVWVAMLIIPGHILNYKARHQ